MRDDTLLSSLFADFGSLSVPLFHKPVTVFLPCSSRLCLMEMNDRVRQDGSRKILTASSILLIRGLT